MNNLAFKQKPFDMFYILFMSAAESLFVAFWFEIGMDLAFNYKNDKVFYFIFFVVLYFNAKINKNINTINELNKIIKENSDEIEKLKKQK